MTGSMLSKLNGVVWIAAYMDNQTECFEIRTRNSEKGAGSVRLLHKEYEIGTSIADFLTVGLGEWDSQLEKLQSCLNEINGKRKAEANFETIHETAQYWLSQSGVFTQFAASMDRLYLDYEAGKALTLDDCVRQMKYFKELQPRLKQLANDFFETDTQQDMRALYFSRQAKRGFGPYPILLCGRLSLCRVVRTPNGFLSTDTVPEPELQGDEDSAVTEVMETNSSQELVDFILYRYITENLGAKATPCPTVADGVRTAIEKAGRDGVVCACGSLYMIGDIVEALEAL